MAVASAGPYASLHLAPDRQPHQHPPLCFLQAGCPSCRPTNSVKALKARTQTTKHRENNTPHFCTPCLRCDVRVITNTKMSATSSFLNNTLRPIHTARQTRQDGPVCVVSGAVNRAIALNVLRLQVFCRRQSCVSRLWESSSHRQIGRDTDKTVLSRLVCVRIVLEVLTAVVQSI